MMGSQGRPKQQKEKMKRKLTKIFCMAGGLAVLITMGTPNTALAQRVGGGPSIPSQVEPSLQGTWDNQVNVIDCQTGNPITSFRSLIVFMAGGTVTETTSGTAPALRTPGEGVWRHTTANNFVLRFKHFRFNTQNVLLGWNIIQAEVSLDAAGNAYTSAATIEVYDPNGVLLATACAETLGTRFEL
jgi:hypothetical protein